ncbi:MAG TPA: nucleotide disphospho-sugar-binding domain-containing protein [Abditibacteriaceae bacterium]|nr:nucleotide disphospho-sugar-binding domain-containing protein [Abditibacteriaceae bacterium]
MTCHGKRIVLTTFGSLGDLHPYMAIALELQRRGHRPVIATSEIYRDKVTAAGLDFHAARPDLPPLTEAGDMIAKVMTAKTGPEYLFKNVLMPHLRESYQDLSEAVRGADLLVTHLITFAGPILAEQTGVPWVSTVLAPISLWSAHDPPVLPTAPEFAFLRALGPAFNRGLMQIGKHISAAWVAPVYRLRAELGLPRGPHPLFEGQHSPALVLALFSAALAAPQPDWPPQTRLTGFPFYDRLDRSGMASEVADFLDAGPPPIVFTLGSSAVFDAGSFFEASIAATQQLGQRAVLLIGDACNLSPGVLPAGIAAFDYAPYSEIFPRAAAIVHQGGVGTTGQAMRAGKPMLIMPYSHDQPDHAARITRLGSGRTLARHRYTATRAAASLRKLLNDPKYAKNAAALGRQVRAEDGARAAADAIEVLANSERERRARG